MKYHVKLTIPGGQELAAKFEATPKEAAKLYGILTCGSWGQRMRLTIEEQSQPCKNAEVDKAPEQSACVYRCKGCGFESNRWSEMQNIGLDIFCQPCFDRAQAASPSKPLAFKDMLDLREQVNKIYRKLTHKPCDCGAETSGTTHAEWCGVKK